MFLLVVYSNPCDILLLLSLPVWYHFEYPRRNRIFTMSTSLWLSLLQYYYPRTESLILFEITFLFLVAIFRIIILVSLHTCDIILLLSSPRRYQFAYTCCNNLLLVIVVFSLYIFSSYCPYSFDPTFHNNLFSSPWTGYRRHCTLKSQLLIVNFYFVFPQFQIKRARFSLVFPTYVQFCTQIVVLYFFRAFR